MAGRNQRFSSGKLNSFPAQGGKRHQSLTSHGASNHYMEDSRSIFAEQYRVVSIAGDHLVIRGILSGEVLTIVNPEPGTPLTAEEYPPGKLIALTDPSAAPLN